MATITRYVDPDVSGGAGDGTSWADAYSSMNTWEAAEQTDLVTDGDTHIAYCRASSGSDDTASTTIVGWTTGAGNDIAIEGYDFPTDGVWDATKYLLAPATNAYTRGISIQETHVTIKNIQIQPTISADPVNNEITIQVYTGSNGAVTIDGCILRASGAAGLISGVSANYSCAVQNTIIYGSAYDYGIDTNDWNSAVIDVDSCVITQCAVGISEQGNGTVNAYNNALFNNTNDISGVTNHDYNATDEGAGEDDGSGHGVDISGTWDSTCFTDTDGEGPDWSMQDADSPLYDVGTSTGRPSTDIIGNSWTTDDIGPFAYVSAGTSYTAEGDITPAGAIDRKLTMNRSLSGEL